MGDQAKRRKYIYKTKKFIKIAMEKSVFPVSFLDRRRKKKSFFVIFFVCIDARWQAEKGIEITIKMAQLVLRIVQTHTITGFYPIVCSKNKGVHEN